MSKAKLSEDESGLTVDQPLSCSAVSCADAKVLDLEGGGVCPRYEGLHLLKYKIKFDDKNNREINMEQFGAEWLALTIKVGL